MTSSTRAFALLAEFRGSMDPTAPSGQQGHKMMEDKLRLYLWWKAKLSEDASNANARDREPTISGWRGPGREADTVLTEALKKG